MNPTNDSLPYHLSERCFRKYESDIALALEKYPQVTVFKPTTNINTFVARLRDSITSFQTNKWRSDKIKPRNDEGYPFWSTKRIVVSQLGDKVLVGSPECVTDAKRVEEQVLGTPTITPVEEQCGLGPIKINALFLPCVIAELAAARVLTRPVTLSRGLLDQCNATDTELEADDLEENFDVLVERGEDGSITIS